MSEVHSRRNVRFSTDESTESTDSRDPLEELAAEFAKRFRQGERVSVEQYARRYPTLADDIRDLFPTIVAMEELNTKRLMESGVQKPSMPFQLGDFRIVAEIARGGMGIVYEAEQVSLGRRVAVKVLPPHALRRERDIRRFEREAHTAAKLHHSNIVPVFGAGEESGQRYIVMQLIRGVGLDEILGEVKRVVVDGAEGHDASEATSRVSTVQRSAVGLLESELKLNTTSVDANAETVEINLTGSANKAAISLAPLAIRASIGAEYFRNVARMGLQVAEAIQYAHQQDTLHRDIKPGNLILDEDGRVWIADFGLAKAIQDDEVTCSGDIVGTMAYVAPERFQGTTTKSSDIYSLGVTLHEMLTLQKAFNGEDRVAVMKQVTGEGLTSPRRLNAAVPRDLETIVMKAASRESVDRYRSAGELASDLEAFLEDRPIKARRLSPLEHSTRWCRRNRGMSALLVLLAMAVGQLAFAYRNADQQRQKEERISKLAIGALDEIYNRFASAPFGASVGEQEVGENEFESPLSATPMPISKDVASLLENLLDFYDQLSTQADDSDLVTAKLISASRRVGDINRRLGQHEDARDSYEDAIDRIKQLDPRIRELTTMRLETARVHNGLGLTYLYDWRNSRNRAKSHREAVSILDHEDADDDERFELATSLYWLHQSERHRNRNGNRGQRKSRKKTIGDDKLRVSHLDRAEGILAQLKEQKPDRPDYDLLLARCLLAERDGSQPGHFPSEQQSQAITILQGLIERYPENPDYQFELGQVYRSSWNRNEQDRSKEHIAEAEFRLRTGLEVCADLEVLHPNIPKYYWLKKELHEKLGRVLRTQQSFSEAEGQYTRAIQMQRMLMNRSEHPDLHRPWLYRLRLDYGKLLRDAGELERAKSSLQLTAEQLENAVAMEQSRTGRGSDHREFRGRGIDSRGLLESTYVVVANVLDQLGEDDASREMMRKAEELNR